jgi:anti-anti-sigma factor
MDLAPGLGAHVSAPDDFHVIFLPGDEESVVQVVGEIDLSTRNELAAALAEASADGSRLAVDLSHATFIDSTGLTVLVNVWRSRREAGLDLVLREPSPEVMRILNMAGLAQVFPIDGPDH